MGNYKQWSVASVVGASTRVAMHGSNHDTGPAAGGQVDDACRRLAAEFTVNSGIPMEDGGRIVPRLMSSAAPEIAGYDSHDFEEDPNLWVSIVHPEDVQRVRRAYDRLADGVTVSEDYRIFRSDGQMRWVREFSTPHVTPADGLTGVLTLVKDVTDEKSVLSQIEQFAPLFREIPSALVVRDVAGRVVWCNDACARIYGFESADQMIGTTFDDIVPLDKKGAFDREVRPRLFEGRWSGEMELKRRDGGLVEVSVETNPIREIDGSPAAIIGTLTDMTERRRGERALRESEEKLRTLVDSVDAVIFTIDPDLKPYVIAGQPERIVGYTTEELMSDPAVWPGAVHPDDLPRLREEARRAAEEHQTASIEFRITTRWGSTRWVRAHATPFYDGQGQLRCFSGVATDVTDRALAQEREARYTARMAALADISQAFGSTLEAGSILESASRRIAEVIGGIGVVASVDPETTRLTQITVSCPDLQRALEVDAVIEESELALNSLFGEDGPRGLLLDDLRRASPEVGEIAAKVGLGPAVVIPVFRDNEAISVLSLVRKAGEPGFSEDDLWFMSEVASHASAALTNALLYRRQSRIAETLQRSLIPESPAMEHLEIASCYVPAEGDVEVGGDFFDVVQFGPTAIGVVAGDVAGKGVTAAVHTAEAKYMLRAFAHASPEPGAVMTRLNKALCAYAEEYTFVTIFYGLIDLMARTLTYVNAGQEVPLILCTKQSSIRELRPTSPVAGVLRHLEYTPESARFEPDDLLICYTDGLTDARGDGERFGYERLYAAVSSAPTTSTEAVRDHILAAVSSFAKGRRPDDQVIVVIRPRS